MKSVLLARVWEKQATRLSCARRVMELVNRPDALAEFLNVHRVAALEKWQRPVQHAKVPEFFPNASRLQQRFRLA
jgi:hypothetical protein